MNYVPNVQHKISRLHSDLHSIELGCERVQHTWLRGRVSDQGGSRDFWVFGVEGGPLQTRFTLHQSTATGAQSTPPLGLGSCISRDSPPVAVGQIDETVSTIMLQRLRDRLQGTAESVHTPQILRLGASQCRCYLSYFINSLQRQKFKSLKKKLNLFH